MTMASQPVMMAYVLTSSPQMAETLASSAAREAHLPALEMLLKVCVCIWLCLSLG